MELKYVGEKIGKALEWVFGDLNSSSNHKLRLVILTQTVPCKFLLH